MLELIWENGIDNNIKQPREVEVVQRKNKQKSLSTVAAG